MQTFEFDLQGQALGPSDELNIEIKDWERVGRNRYKSYNFKLSTIQDGHSDYYRLNVHFFYINMWEIHEGCQCRTTFNMHIII